jgi:molybdopterin converting factor small subunit
MKVFFYGNVLEYTNNEKSCETGNCFNVRELINELGNHYGERLKNFLLSKETCFFLVNGTGIMMTGGLETKLQSHDKIEVLPFAEAG